MSNLYPFPNKISEKHQREGFLDEIGWGLQEAPKLGGFTQIFLNFTP